MKILKKWWIPLFILSFFAGKYLYQIPKFENGERSPNFEWTLPSGEKSDLTKLEGKYVLIDFWGSWCGPCIAEVPGLTTLFDKYHTSKFKNADGFDIVGVGVEKEEKRWRRAIGKYKLVWENHVFDENTNFRFFNSKVAKLYGITEVPTKYLLDEKGVIVLVNPSVEELDEFLRGQL
ncbi:MAG: thiol-disulfide isomerase/thioredoxin [Granulosicoccus sp.]|jgi:thiol-disulfide isomerase/thioredoxin